MVKSFVFSLKFCFHLKDYKWRNTLGEIPLSSNYIGFFD